MHVKAVTAKHTKNIILLLTQVIEALVSTVNYYYIKF